MTVRIMWLIERFEGIRGCKKYGRRVGRIDLGERRIRDRSVDREEKNTESGGRWGGGVKREEVRRWWVV